MTKLPIPEDATKTILALLAKKEYQTFTIVDGIMAINGALFSVLLNNNIPPANAASMLSDFIGSYDQAWKNRTFN